MGMFDFLTMLDNYEDRKIANHRDEQSGLAVDTARVSDASWSSETAVMHPLYNNGNWVVVEGYNNDAEAEKGHRKWVKTMTADTLPASLKESMEALTRDHAYLLEGEVFNGQIIEAWINQKMKEYYEVRNRPHPYEMNLYYEA